MRRRPHGFDFAVQRIELLQRPDAEQNIGFARGPEGDGGVAQAVGREDMASLAGRGGAHCSEVQVQQRANIAAVEIAFVEGQVHLRRLTASFGMRGICRWPNVRPC